MRLIHEHIFPGGLWFIKGNMLAFVCMHGFINLIFSMGCMSFLGFVHMYTFIMDTGLSHDLNPRSWAFAIGLGFFKAWWMWGQRISCSAVRWAVPHRCFSGLPGCCGGDDWHSPGWPAPYSVCIFHHSPQWVQPPAKRWASLFHWLVQTPSVLVCHAASQQTAA